MWCASSRLATSTTSPANASTRCSTLTFIEDRIARMMEIWGGIDAFREHAAVARAERAQAAAPLVNGPKLEGDMGHASQADIDAIFG